MGPFKQRRQEGLAEQVELLASIIYQPRSLAVTSHDVNDPLLLSPDTADQQPPLPLGAGIFAAAATVTTLHAAASENWPLPQQLATRTPQRRINTLRPGK